VLGEPELLSLSRMKVSGEQTQAVCGHPDVWHLSFSNRQSRTVCKLHGGEPAQGLGQETQTHRDPICLGAEDTLPLRKSLCKESSGEGALAAGCGGDEPAGVQGLRGPKPHVPT